MHLLIESTTIMIPIKRKTADVFSEVLDCPMSLLADMSKKDKRWKFWKGFHNKSKLISKYSGEFTSSFLADKIRWNIPIEIIPLGDNSQIQFTVSKTDKINENQFFNKIKEVKISIINLINIIEHN